MSAKYCCVLSTISDVKKARLLAGLLISKRLAACVQILPGLESHYRWQGKKEISREILLLIKTKTSVYKKLEKTILKQHFYEVPEIVCLPITKGSKAYLDWIFGEVTVSK